MKFLFFTILLSSFSVLGVSQTTIIWEGGTPGAETSWENPRNWNTNRLPDELDKVIIYHRNNGHHSMPIINTEITIAELEIYHKAKLTVNRHGTLIIDGFSTYSKGVTIYGGDLIIHGNIEYKNLDELRPIVAHNAMYGM